MAAAERWVDPLENDAATPRRVRRPRPHRLDARTEPGHERVAAFADAERVGHGAHVLHDVGEARRIEVDDTRRPGKRRGERLHARVADGAHVAQPLGDEDVGLEAAEERLVERVERAAPLERLAHPAVDLGARQRRLVDRAMGGARLRVDAGWEVAFVADRDHVVEHVERGDDLGGRREQRDDPHG